MAYQCEHDGCDKPATVEIQARAVNDGGVICYWFCGDHFDEEAMKSDPELSSIVVTNCS